MAACPFRLHSDVHVGCIYRIWVRVFGFIECAMQLVRVRVSIRYRVSATQFIDL